MCLLLTHELSAVTHILSYGAVKIIHIISHDFMSTMDIIKTNLIIFPHIYDIVILVVHMISQSNFNFKTTKVLIFFSNLLHPVNALFPFFLIKISFISKCGDTKTGRKKHQ